jgi:hypothetical protein
MRTISLALSLVTLGSMVALHATSPWAMPGPSSPPTGGVRDESTGALLDRVHVEVFDSSGYACKNMDRF